MMKFNLFRHIKDPQETEGEIFISNSDYKYFIKKFRKSKTKTSLEYNEPHHRKFTKLQQQQGKKK